MYEECRLQANGLSLVALRSRVQPLGEIDQGGLYTALAGHFPHSAFIVAWIDNKVMHGLCHGKELEFYDDEKLDLRYVQKIRVFDIQRELYVWRTNGTWKARLRIDGDGELAEAVMAHQLLLGTRGERLSSQFSVIEEDRGAKLILPLANVEFDDTGVLKKRISIKTHNYIRFNAIHQATYVDCRFVAFTDGQNELT